MDITKLDHDLAASEATVPNLRPDCEKRIVWAGAPGVKTPLVILNIHGFSASPAELRPLPDLVAKELGANIYFARLTGHGQDGDAMAAATFADWTRDVAEAVKVAQLDADLIVNFQGDAPLTPPWFVEDLIAGMVSDASAQMATPVLQCDPTTYAMFKEDRANGRVGGTTVVFGDKGRAIYFSKEVLPFIDPNKVPDADIPVYHHVGVYAYRPEALEAYISWPECGLERLEGLEQLRFLYNNVAVKCVEVEARGRLFWELNNPEDVARIEKVLAEQ